MPFQMPPMPFPMPPLFITAVKDICTNNTFEKLLKVLFSEVSCWHFGFTTPLFSATTTDISLYDVLTLFPRWPFVFRVLFFSLTVVVLFNRLHRVYAVWFQISDFAFLQQVYVFLLRHWNTWHTRHTRHTRHSRLSWLSSVRDSIRSKITAQ